MTKKPLLFLILAGLGLGALSWSLYRSPWFAIYELNQSIQKKDLALFYRRIDLDGLYKSSLDALATKALAEAKQAPDLMDKLNSQLNAGFGKVTRGQSMDLIKHELELEFRRDRESALPLARHLDRNPLRLFLHDLRSMTFGDWVYEETGALVTAQVELLKLKKSYELTFRMTEADSGLWRISGFEGLSSVLSQFEVDRQLVVSEHNNRVQEQAFAKLPFFGETRLEQETGGLSSHLHLEFLFQNKFETEVVELKGTVQDDAASPRVIADFESGPISIKPGEKEVFLIKKEQFLSPFNPGDDKRPLAFRYAFIRLANGDTLGLIKDFDEL